MLQASREKELHEQGQVNCFLFFLLNLVRCTPTAVWEDIPAATAPLLTALTAVAVVLEEEEQEGLSSNSNNASRTSTRRSSSLSEKET
jgi:hypothetical protein